MSRTYRKKPAHHYCGCNSLSQYIDKKLVDYYKNPTKFIWKRKSDKQVASEYKIQEAKFHAQIASLDAISQIEYELNGQVPDGIRPPFVYNKYKIQVPWTREDVINDAIDVWNSWLRDGALSETSRNTGFKQQAARTVRRANKRLSTVLLKGEAYDTPYPGYYLGKTHVWDWW